MQSAIERTAEEISDIERHKYFLSEKAGYDVGWEFAEQDWEAHHSDKFRKASSPETATTTAQSNGISMFFKRIFSR